MAPPPPLPSDRPSFPFLFSVPGMGEGSGSAGEGLSEDPWGGGVALVRSLLGFSLQGRGWRGQTGISRRLGEKGQPLSSPLTCPGPPAIQAAFSPTTSLLPAGRGRGGTLSEEAAGSRGKPAASCLSPASNFLGTHGDSQPRDRRSPLVRVRVKQPFWEDWG